MKKIFVPTQGGNDWQRLLAKPELHWKPGASAMTAAACWEGAGGQLPAEIRRQLDASGDPRLTNLELLAAIPEWEVELPGGTTTSHTDVLAICRNATGLCVIGVEAKVLEDFGPLVGEKRKGASAGQLERLDYLHAQLGVERFDDAIRYQLLHRTVSALLTAEKFHAEVARVRLSDRSEVRLPRLCKRGWCQSSQRGFVQREATGISGALSGVVRWGLHLPRPRLAGAATPTGERLKRIASDPACLGSLGIHASR